MQRGRLARQAARRHHRERLTGIVLAVVGVVVLVVAIVALRDPRSDAPQDAGQSVAVSGTPATPSASRTTTRTTGATPTRTATTSAPPVSLGSASSGSPKPDSSASASAAAKAVPLVVLNNTTVSGLARSAATRFQDGGWTVTSSGNYSNSILSTCAYYDPDASGAKAAAEALRAQFPTIKRTAPRFAELPSGPVVVVLTPDYRSD